MKINDISGTITAGNSAQVLAAAKPGRIGFMIQNTSAGDLWVSDLTTAVLASPSKKITSGSTYYSHETGCSSTALSIIGATTSQAFTAREW